MPKREPPPEVDYNSPEAASIQTVTGWVSRSGLFFGNDEHTARYNGCTRLTCKTCGAYYPKNSYCDPCHDARELAKFEAMPRAAWDGVQMIYSDAYDRYFSTPEEVLEFAADLEGDEVDRLESMRLILCTPIRPRQIDTDYFVDELPEDGDWHDLPAEVQAAAEAFNAAVLACAPTSWSPGKTAWNMEIPT